jgi:hypothetical protein
MCDNHRNPAYSFLKPHYSNYLKAYVHAMRFGIAVKELGIEESASVEVMAHLLDLVDPLWECRVEEAKRRFGAETTAAATVLLEAEESALQEALSHELK